MDDRERERGRRDSLTRAGFNVFNLGQDEVELDFYTDIPPRGFVPPLPDTAYGDDDLREPPLASLLSELYGPARYVATTKGRSAEMALVHAFMHQGSTACGPPLFSSVHHALEHRGVKYVVAPRATDAPGTSNLDVAWVEARVANGEADFLCLEPGTNAFGGLPQQLSNAMAIADVCKKHGARVLLDATRLLANCLRLGSFPSTVKRFVELADAFTISCAKELLVPIGGVIGVRDLALHRAVYQHCLKNGTLLEPHTCRVALARGVERLLRSTDVLARRAGQLEIMAESFRRSDVPFHEPIGGHAIYVAVPEQLLEGGPARLRALECLLYEVTGVRSMLWPVAGMPRGTLRLALAVGRYTDDELRMLGPRFRAFFDRAGEALALVDAPHEELSPTRARYQPA